MFKIFVPSLQMNWLLGNCSVRGDLGSAYLKTWDSREVKMLWVQLSKHRHSRGPPNPAFELTHAELSFLSKLISFRKMVLVSFRSFLWKQGPSVVLPAAVPQEGCTARSVSEVLSNTADL